MESNPSVPPGDGEQLHGRALDNSQRQPSPVHPTLIVVRADGLPHLKTLFLKKERKYYVTATDGSKIKKTSAIRSMRQSVEWNEILSGLTIDPSSRLILHVFARRMLLGDVRLGFLAIPFESIRSSRAQEFDIPFDPNRKTTLVLSIALPEAPQRATSGSVSSPEALPAPSALEGAEPGSPPERNTSSDDFNSADSMQVMGKKLARTRKVFDSMKPASNRPQKLVEAADEAPDQLEKVADLYDTWEVVLDNVKLVVDVVDKIAEIHPWAKMAWSILSCIPKTFIAQVERDENFKTLLAAIQYAFDLAKEAEDLTSLLQGSTQLEIMKQMLRHVGACGDLIQAYAKDTSFWQRLVKNMGDNASGQVKRYSETLVELRRAFLDHAAINTQMAVAELSRELEKLAGSVAGIGLAVKLANIPYPKGARHSEDKRCIPGTRVAFLNHITHWVNNPESPRALVLFGQAGTGKSSIANEVACQFEETHRLASSFVFLRLTAKTEQSDSPAQRLFSGIARNLADRYPTFKASLAKIIDENAALVLGARDRNTPFKSMLLRPLQESPLIGPIFIVIDALDESGDASGRDGLHSFLASHISKLPDTFRILITSRPEKDIVDAFSHLDPPTIAEICHMDDLELSRQTRDDIYAFVRHQLGTSPDLLEEHKAALAQKAENSFQWAAVACNYVQFGPAGWTSPQRVSQLLKLPPESPKSVNFLDSLYKEVLSAYFDDDGVLPLFRSVMGQLIASFEPLSVSSLAALRAYNDPPGVGGDGSIYHIVGYLGSLLSNVTPSKSSLPIVPLHTSFRDFLIDQNRAEKFWINPGDAHYYLTRCSFGLMHNELGLDFCELLSSYDRNPDIQDPSFRITDYISDALSYACRSWADHLEHVSPDKIVYMVRSFFENDFLHWLEAMSLLGAINLVPQAVSILGTWVAKHRDNYHLPELDTLVPWITDALKFVKYFGRLIARSAPHIYLSALPFCPRASIIFDHYSKSFPNTLSLQQGRMTSWPVQEMSIPVGSMCFAIAFSPDGRRIASGLGDRTIHVWGAETGHPIAGPFTGHTSLVRSVAFSPDGRRIASGSQDKTIRIWDAEEGDSVVGPFTRHTDSVNSVAFSPDGRRIASGSGDNTIHVWDAETGYAVAGPFTGHTGSVLSVVFSPDGRRIVSGSHDSTIRVWDAEKAHSVAAPFTGHTNPVRSVAFSPDGHRIASGSHDHTVRVWDAEKGHSVTAPFTGHTSSVSSVAFSPDGCRVASGSNDNTIRVWDAETGHSVAGPFTGHTNPVRSVAFSEDGRRVASGSDDHTIRVWDVGSKENSVIAPFMGHTGPVNSVAFSPDGLRIASSSHDGSIRVWSAQKGYAATGPFTGHTSLVLSVMFSPDNRHIASGAFDRTIRVWDAETGHAVAEPFTGHTSSVLSVAFSPDSRRIASGSYDNTIRVWDAETGHATAAPFTGHTGPVNSVAFSPDGHRVASGSNDRTIQVWDAETGNAVAAPFTGHTNWVRSIAFSPDGHHIVSGSDDHTIRLWDAETGHVVPWSFIGHTSSVTSVVFSPDGRHITSGSHDGTIRVWDAETGHAVAGPFAGHTDSVTSVAFSPDGRHFASGSYDKSIRLWKMIIHGAAGRSGSTPQDVSDPRTAVPGPPVSMDQSVIDDDGWICGQNGELLMWIPEPHRTGLRRPSNVWVAAKHETTLDLSRFVHGRNWTQCGGQMGGTTHERRRLESGGLTRQNVLNVPKTLEPLENHIAATHRHDYGKIVEQGERESILEWGGLGAGHERHHAVMREVTTHLITSGPPDTLSIGATPMIPWLSHHTNNDAPTALYNAGHGAAHAAQGWGSETEGRITGSRRYIQRTS